MGFEKPSQELGVGEILDQTFKVYFSKFFLFYIPFLVAGLLIGIWNEIVTSMFPAPSELPLDAPPDVLLPYLTSLLVVLSITIFLMLLLSWIVHTIVGGMTVKITSDIIEGRRINVSETLSFIAYKLHLFFGAGIITGFLIGAGIVCFIVPGIIFSIMFSLVIPAIVIERVGVLESISRSRKLVGGRWLKTFGFLLVIGIIIFVLVLVFSVFSGLFSPFHWIVNGVLGALVSPIYPIAITQYYYSMAAREQQASTQPTLPSTPVTPQTSSEYGTLPSTTSTILLCVHCGADNQTDSVFCRKCGKKIMKKIPNTHLDDLTGEELYKKVLAAYNSTFGGGVQRFEMEISKLEKKGLDREQALRLIAEKLGM